jgi:hypothetical protein
VTVYIPVPDSNGEEWDRLVEESALSALVGIALEGEYGGIMGTPEGARKEAEALQIRAVAASVFEVFIFANALRRYYFGVNLTLQSHLFAYNTLHLSLLQDLVNNNEQAILGE